ncbi:MAG: GNAT family N-acetyltransferase [Bdellovibrionales bacterium]
MASYKKVRANVLAIGTEVTSGQITNSNAAWIAAQLSEYGFDVPLHMSVPDERPLILSALKHLSAQCEHLFVIGGLGPTTDDFTREVVAQWAQKVLVFDDNELQDIETKMKSRGRKLKESQKQQCYFPEGSKKLLNRVGTASGFTFEVGANQVWILPGPPKELQAIWKDHIHEPLSHLIPEKEKTELYRWTCLGIPEADLAEKVEKALGESKLQRGYRLTPPYVEVKVWMEPHEAEAFQQIRSTLETAISEWIVLKPKEDIKELMAEPPYTVSSSTPLEIKQIQISDIKEYTLHYRRIFQQRGINNATVHPFPLKKDHDIYELLDKRARQISAPAFGPSWEIAWGLFHDKKCYGHVCLNTQNLETNLHRVLLGIGIEQMFWSKGYGKKLMETAISWAKQQKQIDYIDLGVFSQNTVAHEMYLKLGFKDYGSKADAFRIDGQSLDDDLMFLDVRT